MMMRRCGLSTAALFATTLLLLVAPSQAGMMNCCDGSFMQSLQDMLGSMRMKHGGGGGGFGSGIGMTKMGGGKMPMTKGGTAEPEEPAAVEAVEDDTMMMADEEPATDEVEEGVVAEEEEPAPASGESVLTVASGVDELSTLVAAIDAAGGELAEAAADPSLVATVFAPTNDAFDALLEALGTTAEELFSNSTLVAVLLSYHVVPGQALEAADLTDGMKLDTLLGESGDPLTVSIEDDGVEIEAVGSTATVLVPDVAAGQAVVHVIDEVLLPVGA